MKNTCDWKYNYCPNCGKKPEEHQKDHEKPEIRPEKAGELWWCSDGFKTLYYHTDVLNNKLYLISDDRKFCLTTFQPLKKDGWTRIFPSVPDENVASIEIDCAENWKHIECFTSLNKCRYEVTISNVMNKSLSINPSAQMTLKWKKE